MAKGFHCRMVVQSRSALQQQCRKLAGFIFCLTTTSLHSDTKIQQEFFVWTLKHQ
ncbi:hypothetical protein STEG23_019462, partial [Scotinomys teguina]